MGVVAKEWEIRTRSVRPRSAELKRLDLAVLAWATQGMGPGSANLKAVWDEFCKWKQAKPGEFTVISTTANALQDELADIWTAKPANLGSVKSTGTKPDGWVLEDYTGLDLVPANDRVGPLSASEIQRINEAFRRSRLGAVAARDALIKVRSPTGFKTPLDPVQQSYVDFFGAYDATRFQRVLDNLTALALSFGNSPRVVDCRNRVLWSTTYGGCVRANIVNRVQGGVQLTGTVNILIGRSFLGGAGYAGTTDATVGTLVHEFSHGTFNAVDVPEVDDTGVFQCTRQSDNPADANFGNSTDPHNHQASTEVDDMKLARFKPAYAVVNADCYGQFTRRILQGKAE